RTHREGRKSEFVSFRSRLRHQMIEAFAGNPSVQPLVEQNRWAERAVPKTIDRLEADRPVRGGLVKVDAKSLLGVSFELDRPERLARLVAANMDDMPSGQIVSEVMIETDDPVHLRAREIELGSDEGHCILGDVSESGLHLMKDR